MRIYVKKFVDAKWGSVEFLVYREGEYQQPLAILTVSELDHLAAEIRDAKAVNLKSIVRQAKGK